MEPVHGGAEAGVVEEVGFALEVMDAAGETGIMPRECLAGSGPMQGHSLPFHFVRKVKRSIWRARPAFWKLSLTIFGPGLRIWGKNRLNKT
jgi:hypothetical protein